MIDTLEFVRRMMESGMSERTAEQLAHELREALPEADVATKADLAALNASVTVEMEKLRTELKTDMSRLREELGKEMARLRGDLQSSLARMRSSIIVWVAIFVVIGQVLPSVLQFIRSFIH